MVVIFLALTSIYAFYKIDAHLMIAVTLVVFIVNKAAKFKMDHDRKVKKLSIYKVDVIATDINIVTFLIHVIIFIYGMYKMLIHSAVS